MKMRAKIFSHTYLNFIIAAIVIIVFSGMLGQGAFWGIKAAFGYGGGGGGGGGGYASMAIGSPTIDEFESPTDSNYIILSGTRVENTMVYINNSTDSVTYPSDTSWHSLRFLDIGDNTFIIYAKNNSGQTSLSTSISVNYVKAGDVCGGDSIIDDLDLACLAAHWGQNWSEGDLVIDNIIDDLDLALLVSRWGT